MRPIEIAAKAFPSHSRASVSSERVQKKTFGRLDIFFMRGTPWTWSLVTGQGESASVSEEATGAAAQRENARGAYSSGELWQKYPILAVITCFTAGIF